MINFRMLKHSDIVVWACVGLLTAIGILMVFSCTLSQSRALGGDLFFFLKRQFIAFIVGVFGLCFFAYIDYAHLKKASFLFYVLINIVLLVVLYKGYTVLGAQRWISLGPLSFQPSEVMKLILLIFLATYLEGKRGEIKSVADLLMPLLILAVPFAFIFKQPDLGTSIVLFMIFVAMLVWSETSNILLMLLITPLLSIFLKQFLILWIIYLTCLFIYLKSNRIRLVDSVTILAGNIGIGYLVPKLWSMLKDYQRNRLLAFLNPETDPLGVGYHSLQAKIAIGSGGFFGKGYFHGTQTQLSFIPQQFTDFIFSAIGEELGFIGTVFILALFAIILYRAIKIANESRDFYGSLIAAGIAAMIGFQMFINMGMTLGLLPVVGVPLPFISYGGTALVVNMCAIGILQSIAMRRHKLLF